MPKRRLVPPVRTVVAVAAMMLLALGGGGGCASDQQVRDLASSFDDQLKPAEVRSAGVNPYFQQIGARIVAAAQASDRAGYGPKTHFAKGEDNGWMFHPQDIHFDLVNSKTINAFTIGGTHVYIYNELYQQCRTEDELAAVMAHEFGHIYCRHVHKKVNRQMVALGLVGVSGLAGYAAGGDEHGEEYRDAAAELVAMITQFVNMGFNRDDEAQADEMGFHFYCLAGWDPRQFDAFFQHLIDLGYDKTPELESDHPTLKSRVEVAGKRVARLQQAGTIDRYRRPNIATPAQFEQTKQLAVRASQGMPSDQQALQTNEMLQALPRSCWVPYDPPDQLQAWQTLLAKTKQQQQQQQQHQQAGAR